MGRINWLLAAFSGLVLAGPAGATELLPVETTPVLTEVNAVAVPELQPVPVAQLLPSVSLGMGIPKLQIRGFGHAQYSATIADMKNTASTSSNNFGNGGVDLFITSQVAEDITFLNETVFEFGPGGDNILDVERVFLKYEHADWLHLGIGRSHTALGYWNGAYHHGTWLQTTTDRPLHYNFEDDGGILPVHFVGIEASGRVKTGVGAASYNLTVANGRGDITDTVQLVEDANRNKAIGVQVRFEPASIPGFGIGANAYFDKIPANLLPSDGSGPRATSTREQIFGAHAYFFRDQFEALAEFSAILHDPVNVMKDYTHYGGYALVAYRCAPNWKPYYRFDFIDIQAADPFYSTLAEDVKRHTAGVRYDWRTFVALKVEYQHANADSGTSHTATAQASFAF